MKEKGIKPPTKNILGFNRTDIHPEYWKAITDLEEKGIIKFSGNGIGGKSGILFDACFIFRHDFPTVKIKKWLKDFRKGGVK